MHMMSNLPAIPTLTNYIKSSNTVIGHDNNEWTLSLCVCMGGGGVNIYNNNKHLSFDRIICSKNQVDTSYIIYSIYELSRTCAIHLESGQS